MIYFLNVFRTQLHIFININYLKRSPIPITIVNTFRANQKLIMLKPSTYIKAINLNSIRGIRLSSTSSKFAKTDDGSTYVFWHPKEDFPYECTKPLPETKNESITVLKSDLTPQLKEVFNKKSPEMAKQELMNITYTTKHRWFPRARDRKAKKTPMDREYL